MTQNTKDIYINILYLLIICIIGAVFLAQLWISEGIVYSDRSDIIAQHLSLKHTLQKSLSQGEGLAFWDPAMNSGQPAFANPESSYLFPFDLLYFFMPLDKATNLVVLLNFLFAGISMFLFARTILKHDVASLFCATSYMLSYRYLCMIHSGWLPKMSMYALIPLIFLACIKLYEKRSPGSIALVIAAVWLTSVQGDMQIAYYVATICCCWFAVKMITMNPKEALRIFIALIFGTSVGLMLAAPVVLPRIEYAALSSRMIFSYDYFSEMLPGIDSLRTIIDPFDDSGTKHLYWENNFYFGFWAIPLCVYAFIKKGMKCLPYIAVLSVGALMCFETPFIELLYKHFPGFKLFRQPSRILIVIQFFVTIFTALGVDSLIDTRKSSRRQGRYYFILITMILLALIVAAYASLKPIDSFYLLIIFSMGFFFFRNGINKAVALLLCLLPVIDSGSRMLPRIKTLPLKQVYTRHEMHEFLSRASDNRRVLGIGPWCVSYGMAGMYGIRMINGYSSINLKHYIDYFSIMVEGSVRGLHTRPPLLTSPNKINNPELLRALNTGYILANKYYDLEEHIGCKLIKQYKDVPVYDMFQGMIKVPVNIWEIDLPYGEAFFAKSVSAVKNDADSLMALSKSKSAADVFVLGEGIEENIKSLRCEGGSANMIMRGINEAKYRINSIGKNFLVLSQIWYPGWKAFLDGKEVEVYRTNHALIGCFISPGRHIFNIKMTCPEMRRGIKYFFLALAMIFILSCSIWINRIKGIEKG